MKPLPTGTACQLSAGRNSCCQGLRQFSGEYRTPKTGVDFDDASEGRTIIGLDEESEPQLSHANFCIYCFSTHTNAHSSWNQMQRLKLMNSREVITLVFFQNFGKCGSGANRS
jgi:hypothetical protein